MRNAEQIVWVNFDTMGDSIVGMTYALGQLPKKQWTHGDPWPGDLEFAVSECWSFMASDNDHIIWECLMRPDYQWPPVINWIILPEPEGIN